jgi:hypothetical protein
MFHTKHKAEIELNFFEYSNSKRYIAEPDIIEYNRNNKQQYDLILCVKTMKKYGIILDFKVKMITMDEVKKPMQNINYPRLGIPIFGSDFWDPHWKQNSDSVFNSEDFGQIFFFKFRC